MKAGTSESGKVTDFDKFSKTTYAYQHLFMVQGKSKTGKEDLPSLFVFRGTFPYTNIQSYPIERDNSNVYYPELSDVDDLEIEFYETQRNAVWNFFGEWEDSIYAKIDGKRSSIYNIPSVYKNDLYYFRLAPETDTESDSDDDFIQMFGYKYTGCFPKRISDYPADMSSPDAVKLSVQFSVDSVERMTRLKMPNKPLTPAPSDPDMTLRESQPATLKETLKAKAEAFAREKAGLSEFALAIVAAGLTTGYNIALKQAMYMAYNLTGKSNDFERVATGGRVAATLAGLL